MKHFCTHSSGDFLHYGLALFQSLEKHCDDFILYYLCDDLKCFDLLQLWINKHRKTNIVPHWVGSLQIHHPELNINRVVPSFEAKNVGKRTGKDPQLIQWYWTLTPFFTDFCLPEPGNGGMMYVDADIYFFKGVQPIFDILDQQKANIGLVRHRCPFNKMIGEFNCGIVWFNDNLVGWQAVSSWKNWLLGIDQSWKNLKNEKWGVIPDACGDQGFLTLMLENFENVCVLDDFGIQQQAPWSHHFTSQDEDIIYYHFSNFSPRYEDDVFGVRFDPAPRHNLNLIELAGNRKKWFDEYFRETKKFFEELKEMEWMK